MAVEIIKQHLTNDGENYLVDVRIDNVTTVTLLVPSKDNAINLNDYRGPLGLNLVTDGHYR